MVLIDSGAEVNVMRESFARRAQLPIRSLPKHMRHESLVVANGTTDPFTGIVETVVKIGGIGIWTPLLVTRHCNTDVILGEPF